MAKTLQEILAPEVVQRTSSKVNHGILDSLMSRKMHEHLFGAARNNEDSVKPDIVVVEYKEKP